MKEFEVKKVTEDSLKQQNYNEEQIQDYKNKASNKMEQAKYEAILEFTNEKNNLKLK